MLAIERLKLTVFYLQLFEWTSQSILKMTMLTRDDILSVKAQKQEEDDYFSSKGPKPELKPMSIDMQSVHAHVFRQGPSNFG